MCKGDLNTQSWKILPVILFPQMFEDIALKVTIIINYNDKYEFKMQQPAIKHENHKSSKNTINYIK